MILSRRNMSDFASHPYFFFDRHVQLSWTILLLSQICVQFTQLFISTRLSSFCIRHTYHHPQPRTYSLAEPETLPPFTRYAEGWKGS